MPNSSSNSLIRQASGVSPGSILPPGNSHIPARFFPAGRLQINTRPSTSTSAAAATSKIEVTPGASRAVVPVELDIALGQIAGPHRRAGPADADIDGHLQLGVFH